MKLMGEKHIATPWGGLMTIIVGLIIGLYIAKESEKVLKHQQGGFIMFSQARDHNKESKINIQNTNFGIAA